MEFDGFDWDDGNWPKCGKHGVAKEEIEIALRRDRPAIFEDVAHSSPGENRYFAISRDVAGHAGLFVGFTIRSTKGGVFVRPVTARYMHAREIIRYERLQIE